MEIGNFEDFVVLKLGFRVKNWYSQLGHYIPGGMRTQNSCPVQGDNSGSSLSMDPSNENIQLKCTRKVFHFIFVFQKSTPT